MFEHPKSNQQYGATFILSSVCRILNIADHASYARAATAIKKKGCHLAKGQPSSNCPLDMG